MTVSHKNNVNDTKQKMQHNDWIREVELNIILNLITSRY